MCTLLAEAGALVWGPGPGLGERLFRAATAASVRGVRIFDLRIALIASDSGAAAIWTRDRGLVSLPGVRGRYPRAATR